MHPSLLYFHALKLGNNTIFFCLFSIYKCPDNLSLVVWYRPSPFFACASAGSGHKISKTPPEIIKANSIIIRPRCVLGAFAFSFMWINIVWLTSDRSKMHLYRNCKEGLRVGSSTSDNKVKMITVPAAANKSHIITTPANRLWEALGRFGLFVRLKDLFLCLSHVTQIVYFFSAGCDVFVQLEHEYSEWSNQT